MPSRDDAWFESLTGRTLNAVLHLHRNHYDRFVHFVYGLLIAYPIREFVVRVANVPGTQTVNARMMSSHT